MTESSESIKRTSGLSKNSRIAPLRHGIPRRFRASSYTAEDVDALRSRITISDGFTALPSAFTLPERYSAILPATKSASLAGFSSAASSPSSAFSGFGTRTISGTSACLPLPQFSRSSAPYRSVSAFISVSKTPLQKSSTSAVERKFSERKILTALSSRAASYFGRLSSSAEKIDGSAPRNE